MTIIIICSWLLFELLWILWYINGIVTCHNFYIFLEGILVKIDLISEENSEYVVITKAKLDKQSISAIYLLGVLHNPNHTCVCVCVCVMIIHKLIQRSLYNTCVCVMIIHKLIQRSLYNTFLMRALDLFSWQFFLLKEMKDAEVVFCTSGVLLTLCGKWIISQE